MMINIKLTDIVEVGTQFTKNIPLAIIIGSLFIYELYTIMPFTFNNIFGISALLDLLNILNYLLVLSNLFLNNVLITYNPAIVDITFTNYLHIQAIGQNLYTYGAILLIILSIILFNNML